MFYEDLNETQRAYVTHFFLGGDPKAFTYKVDANGNVLTRQRITSQAKS
ncbi:hypothetical protein [Pseudanabaena sp. FACHB-2040]|nr:hypothetical protein [Pseudanabaena sp. FACHB-2040]MBD2261381.1 hypothetical protein [Pseudanabaena sp. FACHB-2040]